MSEKKYKVRSIDVWDDERSPVIVGVIERYETMKVGKEDRETMVIDTGLSKFRVWKSKALEDAFEMGDPGDGIRIEYKGTRPLQGGKTYRNVSVQVWEGGNIAEIQREQTTGDDSGEGS